VVVLLPIPYSPGYDYSTLAVITWKSLKPGTHSETPRSPLHLSGGVRNSLLISLHESGLIIVMMGFREKESAPTHYSS
jgi:hypothetical protein